MQKVSSAKIADSFAIFCAVYLPWLTVGGFFIFSVYVSILPIYIGAVGAGVFGRFVVHPLIHLFYKERRPIMADRAKPLILSPSTYSFPSGHASFFLGMGFFFLFYFQELGTLFILLALVIGLARVYCKVHYWQDVVGSVFVGLLSAFIIHILV